MFDRLVAKGFDIRFESHAQAILERDFSSACWSIEQALADLEIPVSHLVGSGGGESLITQGLRRRLEADGWAKHQFSVTISVDGTQVVSQSHAVDHFRRELDVGSLALEIEWNNKDPFFDRDLDTFRRLHAQGALSVGIVVTRGESLQVGLVQAIQAYLASRVGDGPMSGEADLRGARTGRQNVNLAKLLASGRPYSEAAAMDLVRDKFGAATTHWAKLRERLERGAGKPCPLLLLGIPVGCLVPD